MLCDHSFESAQRADSNEWSQDMISSRNKNIFGIVCFWKMHVESQGLKHSGHWHGWNLKFRLVRLKKTKTKWINVNSLGSDQAVRINV